MEARGSCGGPLKPGLAGSRSRRAWCPYNAEEIELGAMMPVDEILGASCPSPAFSGFHSPPDETGEIIFMEVDRCPLVSIDPGCPHYDPSWLGEVADTLLEIQSGVPSSWMLGSPTPVMRDGIVAVKSQVETAGAHKSKTEESW